MSPAFSPLRQYSRKILQLLQQSATQNDPARFLYKKKARSTFFMAESLTHILTGFSDSKLLAKGRKKTKKVEDLLGKIEDYDAWHLLFSKNKAVKKQELEYFSAHREKELKKLNKKLAEKKFYLEFFGELAETELVHFNKKELIKKLELELKKELEDCYQFYLCYPVRFTSLEGQVHEMRRRLRWISIYAQSFDGIIVLDAVKKKYSWEKEFITAAGRRSSYNKVPLRKNLEAYIHFNKKAFQALNHTIEVLGKIKDKGYHLEELAGVLRKTAGLSKHKAMQLAARQLKANYTGQQLFEEAHTLLHAFFIKYKLHTQLLAG